MNRKVLCKIYQNIDQMNLSGFDSYFCCTTDTKRITSNEDIPNFKPDLEQSDMTDVERKAANVILGDSQDSNKTCQTKRRKKGF